MKKYNVLLIYSPGMTKILMCKRLKNPYIGLNNLVGGKIEEGESSVDAAYRELFEETGITKNDVVLHHLMDFTYYMSNIHLEVFAGRLIHDVEVFGDENILFWSNTNNNFFDMSVYAGEGNIGHMIEQAKLYKEKLFYN